MAKRRANGEGSMYFNNTIKKWQTRFEFKGQIKTLSADTQKEVIQKKKEFLKNQKNKQTKNSTTLYKLMEEFINDKYISNRVNANTYKTDKDTLKRLSKATFINKKVNEITKQEIKEYLSGITNYSASTIKKDWSILNNGFRLAKDKELINNNPCDSLEVNKPKSKQKAKKVTALTVEEQQKFIETINNLKVPHEYQNIWLLTLYTGMRIGETLNLHKDDVDFKNKIIHIKSTLTRDTDGHGELGDKTKTDASERDIRMMPAVEKLLHKILENYIDNSNNLIFCRDNGEFITEGSVYSALVRFCKKYDITNKISDHILRHTYATRMIEAGVPSHVIQKMLGHERISTTIDTYTEIFEKYEKKYDEEINKYYSENNLNFNELTIQEIVNNELKEILNLVNMSHLNLKQKELLNNDIIKTQEWYELL